MDADLHAVRTRDDADALITGLALLSTGGGGWPRRGREYLCALLDEGFTVEWIRPETLPPGSWACSVFGMGSTAPHPPMTPDEMRRFGVSGELYPRPGVRALDELSSYTGQEIGAIVAFELGGFNTSVAIDAAVRSGRVLIDGDFCGRSVPEMSQALPATRGVAAWPLAICDQWGNSLLLRDCPSAQVAERIGKMVSIVSKAPNVLGTCAHAAFLVEASRLPEVIVPGSLSLALAIGRSVLQARWAGADAVGAALAAIGGQLLFCGVVSAKSWQDREGYQVGATEITGEGEYLGQMARVWFQNENHVVWRDDQVVCTSPDLISVVDWIDASARTNTELQVGERVAVLGRRAAEPYREGEPLALMGPRHYGFDFDYVPLETIARV